MRDYNSYGRLSDRVLDNLQKGDQVEFIYHKVKEEIRITGIWDGEKSIFDDKEHTIIRTKEWLKKL